MLLTVVHDQEGAIVGAVAHPPGTPPAGPPLGPGQSATEVDVPELAVEGDPAAAYERIALVVEEYRVDTGAGDGDDAGAGAARLVRK